MRIGIRGKQVPVALIALLLVVAGAGAAAGVTMQGDVQGDATTKVDQAITAEGIAENGTNANNALGTVNDDGTEFKFSANVNQGDEHTVYLNLTNNGNQAVNGRLVLDVPEPLEVEVQGNDNTSLARTSMYRWQLQIDDTSPINDGGDITLTIATPDDVEPGFYTIEGEIRPEEV